MTDYELAETLKTAAKSVGNNIALQMLLLMAAERIDNNRYFFVTKFDIHEKLYTLLALRWS
jgi:hypothetical protein